MTKKYLDINVHEAFRKRMDYIFKEFENVYVSFSGGKDSGLLTNLVLDYMKEKNIGKKLGVFHLDFEAQYDVTTKYVESCGDPWGIAAYGRCGLRDCGKWTGGAGTFPDGGPRRV